MSEDYAKAAETFAHLVRLFEHSDFGGDGTLFVACLQKIHEVSGEMLAALAAEVRRREDLTAPAPAASV